MSRGEVVVIGAGLAGVNSAWFLHKAGYSVRVIDRCDEVGMETSRANGGMATPSMSDPWNAPGVHWQLLRWLGRSDAPMLLRPSALHHYLGWGVRFLAHSRPVQHQSAVQANFALSALSMKAMKDIRDECGFDYALSTRGTIKIYRDRPAFDAACAAAEHLLARGLQFTPLDAAGAVRAEPQLAEIEKQLAGAIAFPADEIGDAHRYCLGLRASLEQRGVSFTLLTQVRRIIAERGAVRGVETSAGVLDAQDVVLAAASWSPQLAAPLGVHLAIRPVKGYSLSVPLRDAARMPALAIIDDTLHTSAAPLGAVLRIAGTAEFSGFDTALRPERLQNLWNYLDALGPSLAACADRERTTPWCGLRPMAADGRPYIGATAVGGLWLNCGHGHLGWTQGAGSGRLLAQLMSGAATSIDPQPYALGRGAIAR